MGLLQIMVLAGIVYGLYVVFRRASRGGGGRWPCATCRNCGRIFADGVLCRFQGRETFKNETHIGNCVDYQRR
ncbi:MAG: hypothetical protein KDC98_09135 [Planctomycetes bacterium]|nr:hypothetical protein [Planctomycetota bacterium]